MKKDVQQWIVTLSSYVGMQPSEIDYVIPYSDLYLQLTSDIEIGKMIGQFLKARYARALMKFFTQVSKKPRRVAYIVKSFADKQEVIGYAHAREDIYRIYYLLNKFSKQLDFFIYASDLPRKTYEALKDEFFEGDDSASSFLRKHLLLIELEKIREGYNSLYTLLSLVSEKIKVEKSELELEKETNDPLSPKELWEKLSALWKSGALRWELVWNVLIYGFCLSGYFLLPPALQFTGVLAMGIKDIGLLIMKAPKYKA